MFKSFLVWLWNPIQNTSDAFKIKDGGYSMRKILAFETLNVALYGCIKIFGNEKLAYLFISTLLITLSFVGLCIGIVTFAELVKFKSGGSADGLQKNEPAIPPVTSQDEKSNIDTNNTQ